MLNFLEIAYPKHQKLKEINDLTFNTKIFGTLDKFVSCMNKVDFTFFAIQYLINRSFLDYLPTYVE
jgi:hypothetical protein